MSIVNLQRDAFFVAPEKVALDWGAEILFNEGGATKIDADSTVYENYSQARSSRSVSVVITDATYSRSMGLYMRPPGLELTPYRVKCYAGANDAALSFRLIIGYAEGTITGTDDIITFYSTYTFTENLDQLFMIEPSISVDTHPIYFGILLRGVTAGAIVDASISVQNLSTSPPQFSQSVS